MSNTANTNNVNKIKLPQNYEAAKPLVDGTPSTGTYNSLNNLNFTKIPDDFRPLTSQESLERSGGAFARENYKQRLQQLSLRLKSAKKITGSCLHILQMAQARPLRRPFRKKNKNPPCQP